MTTKTLINPISIEINRKQQLLATFSFHISCRASHRSVVRMNSSLIIYSNLKHESEKKRPSNIFNHLLAFDSYCLEMIV